MQISARGGAGISAGFGNQSLATGARDKLRRGTIIGEPVVARNLFPFIVALDSRFPRPFRAAPTTSAAGRPDRRDQLVGLRLAALNVSVRLPLLVRQPLGRKVRRLHPVAFHGRRVRPPSGQCLGRRALFPKLLQARQRTAPDVRQGVGRVAAHGAEPGIHQGVPGIAGGHEAGAVRAGRTRRSSNRRPRDIPVAAPFHAFQFPGFGCQIVLRRHRGQRHIFFVVREAALGPAHNAAGTVAVAGTLGATLWSASGAAIAWAVVTGAFVAAALWVVVENIPIKGRLPRRAHRVHAVNGRCRRRRLWWRGDVEVWLGEGRPPHLPGQIVVYPTVAAEARHGLLQHGQFPRGKLRHARTQTLTGRTEIQAGDARPGPCAGHHVHHGYAAALGKRAAQGASCHAAYHGASREGEEAPSHRARQPKNAAHRAATAARGRCGAGRLHEVRQAAAPGAGSKHAHAVSARDNRERQVRRLCIGQPFIVRVDFTALGVGDATTTRTEQAGQPTLVSKSACTANGTQSRGAKARHLRQATRPRRGIGPCAAGCPAQAAGDVRQPARGLERILLRRHELLVGHVQLALRLLLLQRPHAGQRLRACERAGLRLAAKPGHAVARLLGKLRLRLIGIEAETLLPREQAEQLRRRLLALLGIRGRTLQPEAAGRRCPLRPQLRRILCRAQAALVAAVHEPGQNRRLRHLLFTGQDRLCNRRPIAAPRAARDGVAHHALPLLFIRSAKLPARGVDHGLGVGRHPGGDRLRREGSRSIHDAPRARASRIRDPGPRGLLEVLEARRHLPLEQVLGKLGHAIEQRAGRLVDVVGRLIDVGRADTLRPSHHAHSRGLVRREPRDGLAWVCLIGRGRDLLGAIYHSTISVEENLRRPVLGYGGLRTAAGHCYLPFISGGG